MINGRVRVLHIVLDLDAGGLERLVTEIVRHMDRDRFESHVLVLQFPGRTAGALGDAAELHVAPPLPVWSLLWPAPLTREIRRIAPDVVHTHSGVWFKGSLAARRAGVPRVIHTDHGRRHPDPWIGRALEWLASRRTDVVVAVSETLAGHLAETIVGRSRRIAVVVNGVDTNRFRPRPDPGALRRELNLAPDTPIIGSIGRLDYVKGYDLMLEAFARLATEWRGAQRPALALVGDGPEEERLQGQARALGLGGQAFFMGWRDPVDDLLAGFTLYTLASRSEGTSIGLLEAMSAGCCPVVTDVGGNRHVLGPELAHRLVPPGDPMALAGAWREALVDPARRREDAQAARARVREVFAVDAMVRRYEALYTEAS